MADTLSREIELIDMMAAFRDRVHRIFLETSLKYTRNFITIYNAQREILGGDDRVELLPILERVGLDRALRQILAARTERVHLVPLDKLVAIVTLVSKAQALRLSNPRRWADGNVARVRIVNALKATQKYGSMRWWVKRLENGASTPPVLREIEIDVLFQENRIDDVTALLRRDDIPNNLRLRADVEIGFRKKSKRRIMAALDQFDENVPHEKRAYFAWLASDLSAFPEPPAFMDPKVSRAILKVSSHIQKRVDHLRLRATLRPRPSQAFTGANAYWWGLEHLVGAGDWETAAQQARDYQRSELPEPAAIRMHTLRADVTAAVGNDPEGVLLSALDEFIECGRPVAAARFARIALGRRPTSAPILDRYISLCRKYGAHETARKGEIWRERYCIEPAPPRRTKNRCFIVANGPSVLNMPLHLLRDEDVFIVNRGGKAIDLGLSCPRFLVVSDPSVYRDYWREIDRTPVETVFVSGACLFTRSGTSRIGAVAFGSTGISFGRGNIVPSARTFHVGGSVVVLATQIAHFLGYDEINILGADLDYSGPVTHFYGSPAKEARRLSGFRTGGAGAEGVSGSMARLSRFLSLREKSIWNVGIGGNLNSIPRRTLEDAIAGIAPAPGHAMRCDP